MIRRLLLCALLLAAPVFAKAPPPSKWEPEIAAFEKKDSEAPPEKGGTLFIGSSSIRLWTGVAEDFPQIHAINRGFGGSTIADSVAFVDRIVVPYAPKRIVFYAGGNDINAGEAPPEVAADFSAFVEKVRAKLPDTEIFFISIAPNPKRWSQIEQIRDTNARIAKYCGETPRLRYVDVFTQMLGPDGQPKEGIYRDDQLHMNPEGYKIWKAILTPLLSTPSPGEH